MRVMEILAALCCGTAFFKYGFLKAAPITAHNVADLISDGFLVIDGRYNIVDYNKAMLRFLPEGGAIPQGMRLEDFLEKYGSPGIYQDFLKLHAQSAEEKYTISVEYASRNTGRYYVVEITPVFKKRLHIGSVILLKDVTQAKRDLETIKETQAIMIERERLAFLGQLIGGITHNLKTPILSIAGGIEALQDLAAEYRDCVGDPAVTAEDHREIAAEMFGWMEKMKDHCTYISDMITTVKGQAVQFNHSNVHRFTVDEFLKRVEFLMKSELKRHHCTLRTKIEVDLRSEIAGDVNSLVQIFDNLIINALHAYEGKNGYIDLSIREEENKLIFLLTDYGKGIAPEVKARLFKEMVTTKGKNGTGLGLYLSYSTLKGHFNGRIAVDSAPGKGATFTISIPKYQTA